MSSSILKQYFETDGNQYEVINKIDTTELERANYRQRKENPKGWTTKKNWMHVARFYPAQIQADERLKAWWDNRNKDPKYAAACLSRYLDDNPGYKVSDVKIAKPTLYIK